MPLSNSTQVKQPSAGIRKYRLTVRMRLALTYCALLTGSGIVLLGLVYAFMRFVPTYDLAPSTTPALTGTGGAIPLLPSTGTPSEVTPATPSLPAAELLVSSTDQMLNLLLVVSAVVLAILAIIGVGVGWAVAGRMLRPLTHINAAVHAATQGDLSQRIGLSGPRDEISELATNFDTMLEQLERSFAASKRFASNASHELRTPLATSRAMLEVALAQHTDQSVHKVLSRLQIMNERSIEITTALLELARIDAVNVATQSIDLPEIVGQVSSFYQSEAAARGVRMQSSLEPASVSGDPVLIRQLVSNLVQNAIMHNLPQSGELLIETSTNAQSQAILHVCNTGAVLEPSVVQNLTEPFYRVAGRTSSSGSTGHGLGLSIVAAIVERHRGTIDLVAAPTGGLNVLVSLPGNLPG